MSEQLPFFKFNPSQWLTGDIAGQEYDTQGVFTLVCCYYWMRDCQVTLAWMKARLKGAESLIDQLIKDDIVKHNATSDELSIDFLNEQWDGLSESHKKNVINGRKGGKASAKARSSVAAATVEATVSTPIEQPSSIKKKSENKKKIKEFVAPTVQEVIKYFEENGYTAYAGTKAFRYYDAAKWHDSQGKQVRNWKQKMQGVWFKEENKQPSVETGKSVYSGQPMN